jgi:hypothetical protein
MISAILGLTPFLSLLAGSHLFAPASTDIKIKRTGDGDAWTQLLTIDADEETFMVKNFKNGKEGMVRLMHLTGTAPLALDSPHSSFDIVLLPSRQTDIRYTIYDTCLAINSPRIQLNVQCHIWYGNKQQGTDNIPFHLGSTDSGRFTLEPCGCVATPRKTVMECWYTSPGDSGGFQCRGVKPGDPMAERPWGDFGEDKSTRGCRYKRA